MRNYLRNIIKCLFFESFQQIESERKSSKQNLDYSSIYLITTATLCLVFVEYFGSIDKLAATLVGLNLNTINHTLKEWLSTQTDVAFTRQIIWVLVTISGFLLIPILYIKLIIKQPLSKFAWQIKINRKDVKIYLLFLFIMLPLVILVSFAPAFRAKYPFYKPNFYLDNWQYYFLIWEILYLLQFIAVEFFFRGFILHGLKYQFGFYSIWITLVPYCMIHFSKPLPETLGAIIAGIVLGAMSLKSNSIWLGVLLHTSVALTMDLLALWHRGLLS